MTFGPLDLSDFPSKEEFLTGLCDAIRSSLKVAIPRGIVKPPIDGKKFGDENVAVLRKTVAMAMSLEFMGVTDDEIRAASLKALELEKVETV